MHESLTSTSTVVEEVVIVDPVTEAPQSARAVSRTPTFHGAYGDALTVARHVFGVIVSDQPSISVLTVPGGKVEATERRLVRSMRDPTVQDSHEVGIELEPACFAMPIRSRPSWGYLSPSAWPRCTRQDARSRAASTSSRFAEMEVS